MKIQAFDYVIDVEQSLLWEYNEALALQLLVLAKQTWYDENQTDFWDEWYTNVFNLQTANDFGLAVWSVILGLPLFIAVAPDSPSKPVVGFDAPNYQNFDNGNFAVSTNEIVLNTAQKRLVLQLRYFQLVTRGAITEINNFLNYLFFENYGAVYALDGLDMTMVYVFMNPLDSNLMRALIQYDILPRPAGVGLRYVDATRLTVGFDNLVYQNFDNGTFLT